MAWGDKGTLFVGSFFEHGNVYAVVDEGGKKTVKTVLKGMKMPTGIAFRDGALYVADIDKIYKYDNAEANLDNMPKPQGRLRRHAALHSARLEISGVRQERLALCGRSGRRATSACRRRRPRRSGASIRRPALAEIVALGVRNSVGGDVDPRTGDYWFTENARDWLGDDIPSDKLNHITKIGEHFGYPYCHQGDMPDPKFAMGHKCSEFAPPALKLGAHVAPLGMKFYTGNQFPADYKNNMIIAEHGSWNRHKFQGGAADARHRRSGWQERQGGRSSPPAGSAPTASIAAGPMTCCRRRTAR